MAQMTEEFDTAHAMHIINHPVRVRIIELLATKGPMSWKELSTELGTRTGALYHHLDTLERVVTKDHSKRYALTKLGENVYGYLRQNPSSRSAEDLTKVIKQRSTLAGIAGFFIPRSLIHYTTSSASRSAVSIVVISLVVGGLAVLSGNQIVLFSFSPSPSIAQSVGSYVASLLAVSGFAYVALRITGERANSLALVAASSLSFLPLADMSLVMRSMSALGFSVVLSDRTTVTAVFAALQAWAAGIVGAGMSVASGVRIERTLLLSLILLYITMVIMFAQGGRLA